LGINAEVLTKKIIDRESFGSNSTAYLDTNFICTTEEMSL